LISALEIVWIVLAVLEVVPFGAYLFYMRNVALYRPWNVKIDNTFEPYVSILLPIFNESSVIEKKLNNIIESNYPLAKIEIVIVDSASTDGTVDLVRKWSERNPNVRVNLYVEEERKGMVHAENVGLDLARYMIVVKTDADCFWQKDSLRKALSYLSDPQVGAVAGLHSINSTREGSAFAVEKKYRDFYAWLRVGESKIFGTVLYEGELMAFKKDLLQRFGGFDQEIGGDDVPLALKMAQNHYRAISASDAYFVEFVPYSWKTRFSQKMRRGKHVIQALWKYRRTKMNGGISNFFVPMETYIYTLNPVLFLVLCAATIPFFYFYPILLVVLIPIVVLKSARELFATHLTNSLIMTGAILSLLFGFLTKRSKRHRDVVWSKVDEIRSGSPSQEKPPEEATTAVPFNTR
jgi:biofilm PGA synthesis N-glycosyltransferase PgaC